MFQTEVFNLHPDWYAPRTPWAPCFPVLIKICPLHLPGLRTPFKEGSVGFSSPPKNTNFATSLAVYLGQWCNSAHQWRPKIKKKKIVMESGRMGSFVCNAEHIQDVRPGRGAAMTFLELFQHPCYSSLTLEAVVDATKMKLGSKQGISCKMSPALSWNTNWQRTG